MNRKSDQCLDQKLSLFQRSPSALCRVPFWGPRCSGRRITAPSLLHETNLSKATNRRHTQRAARPELPKLPPLGFAAPKNGSKDPPVRSEPPFLPPSLGLQSVGPAKSSLWSSALRHVSKSSKNLQLRTRPRSVAPLRAINVVHHRHFSDPVLPQVGGWFHV